VQRFQDPTGYKPGDEVNGHVLGTDNLWHSMAAVQLTTPPLPYWGRYRKSWRKTYLVFAVLGPLSWMTTPAASHDGLFLILLNLILAATFVAAFVAAFVNLLVAIPPSASSQRLPSSSVPVRPDDDPPADRGGPLSVIRRPARSKWALAAGLAIAVIAAAVIWGALASGGGSHANPRGGVHHGHPNRRAQFGKHARRRAARIRPEDLHGLRPTGRRWHRKGAGRSRESERCRGETHHGRHQPRGHNAPLPTVAHLRRP
jgi:hypothetical protein